MYEAGTTRFVIESLNGSGGVAFKTPSTARMIIDDNSRVSLSNNDAGADSSTQNGLDSTSGNTLFGYLAGGTIDLNTINNTFVGHKAGSGSKSDAQNNTAFGAIALSSLTSGDSNVAIGKEASENLTTGNQNVVIGTQALHTATDVSNVVAIGLYAGLDINSSVADGTVLVGRSAGENIQNGARNTAVGYQAMLDSIGAGDNSVLGYEALKEGTTSEQNVAVGTYALGSNSASALTGNENVAVGFKALYVLEGASASNIVIGFSAKSAQNASNIVSIGRNALGNLTTSTNADGSVAIGTSSLKELTTGTGNTAVGFESLKATQTGTHNTALGNVALDACTGSSNTAVGFGALGSVVGGGTNIGIGSGAGNKGGGSGADLTTGNNNTLIGNVTRVSTSGASNQTVLGYDAIGQADNSVTLGNADVTAVYMAQDSGAVVHASGLKFDSDQTNNIDEANTLDDYEEGEYTGVVTCGTSGTVTITSSNDQLSYIKIGNQVTVNGLIVVGSVSSPNGFFKVSLPFAIGDGTELSKRSGSNVYVYDHTSGNISDFVAIGIEGESSVRVYFGDGSGFQSDSANILANGSNIVMGFTYFV